MNSSSISLMTACLAATAGTVMATEYGRVLSSTPITAQVLVPQQQCADQQQSVPARCGICAARRWGAAATIGDGVRPTLMLMPTAATLLQPRT